MQHVVRNDSKNIHLIQKVKINIYIFFYLEEYNDNDEFKIALTFFWIWVKAVISAQDGIRSFFTLRAMYCVNSDGP